MFHPLQLDVKHLACACELELSRVYAWVLNAYAQVLNAICSGVEGGGIEGVHVGVEHVHVGVERVRAGAYVQVSRVAVSRARESGQMGWESESETHES